MENNVVSFTQEVLKKDLKDFSSALYKETIRLQIENEQLKQKIIHLEELLVNSNVPKIGESIISTVKKEQDSLNITYDELVKSGRKITPLDIMNRW